MSYPSRVAYPPRRYALPTATATAGRPIVLPATVVIDRPQKVVAKEEEEVRKSDGGAFWRWLIALVILALLAWWLISWLSSMNRSNKGRLIVAVTSSAPRSSALNRLGGTLTKATATIDHIQALPVASPVAGSKVPKGWVNLTNSNQKIDLLALRNSSPRLPQILVDDWVAPLQYQRIKFNISKIEVEDSQGNKGVFTPSNTIELEAPFNVNVKKDSTTTVVIDIPLDESVRDAVDEAGRPVKVFAPIINFETRGDAQVTTANKKLMVQRPGVLQHQGQVSMDVNGQMDKGLGIPLDAGLRVNKGKINMIAPVVSALTSPPSPQVSPSPPPPLLPSNIHPASFIDRLPLQPPLSAPLAPSPPPPQVAPSVSRTPLAVPLPPLSQGDQLGDEQFFQQPWKTFPAMISGKYNRPRQ